MTTETSIFDLTTDKLDYAPGDTALFTLTGVDIGGSVEFQVLHVSDPGDDGVYGTSDDTLDAGPDGATGTADDGYGTTGAGHDPFVVTDGGVGDLDGVANGTIETDWYVNPDDSLNETFLLSATDTSTGEVATTTFTDGILGGFNIDGNVLGAGGEEVDAVFFSDPNGNADELGAVNSNTTKIGNIHGDTPPTLEYTNPNPGNDLTGVWLDTNVDANGDVWLYFAFSRDAATNGQVGFEFQRADAPLLNGAPLDYDQLSVVNPPGAPPGSYTETVIQNYNPWSARSGDGTQGESDFLIVFDIQGNNLDVGTRFFDSSISQGSTTGGWTPLTLITDPTLADAAIDLGDPNDAGDDGLRGEGAINLSQTVFPSEPTSCLSIATIIPYTVTGNSDQADFKDVVLSDFASEITISNCGTVRVMKVTDPSGSTEDFDITLFQDDNGNVNFMGDASLGGTLMGDGSVVTFTELLADTDYKLTETNLPQGWVIDNISVEGQDTDYDPSTETFSVAAGATTVITITNLLPFVADPSYTIDKTVTSITNPDLTDGGSTVDQANDVINYSINVANTGNQGITNVTVSDPLLSNIPLVLVSGDTDNDGVLDADESSANPSNTADFDSDGDGKIDSAETWTYTGSYTATQADIDSNGIDSDGLPDGDGDIDNTATVTSTEITTPQDATEDVPVDQNPAYVIAKTVTDVGGDGATGVVDAAGDVISYEITVDNTGNQSINGVNVSDPLIGTNLSAATESGGTGTNGDGILDVGETWTYTGTYTAVQGDIDDNGGGDGDIDNTATVTSTEITDPQSATEDVPVDQNPAYVIAKTVTDVGGDGATGVVDAAGDVISYEITVDNTGNQSINGVNVSDPLIGTNLSAATESGGTGTNGDGILDVGETWTYTGTYTAVQGDIDDNGGGDGDIDNTATVTSTEITDPQSATEDVPVDQNPAYVIAKTVTDVGGDGATGVVDAAGDVISYEITVDNTGNQSINGVNVSDPLIGTNLSAATESGGTGTNGDGILDVGETWTYTGTYTAVQGDIDDNGGGDGDIDNTATVTSTEITDPQSATEDVPVDQNPAYVIAKTVTDVGGDGATGVVDAAGDVISYEITVDNTGNQSINGVNVSDPLIGTNLSAATESGGTGTNGDGILDVGETWTYTGTYTAVQGDIDDNGGGDGDIDNTATVTSTEITDPQSATEDVPVDQNPAYVIAKTVTDVGGDGATGVVDAAGDVISYEITVDNTGNQSINGVNVSDPLIGTNLSAATESGGTGTNGDGILDVGETWTYTGTYTAVQGDIDDNGGGDGDIDNTATVTSTEITDPQSATEDVPVDQNPAYVIAKTVTDVGGDGATGVVDAAGDVISYEITVDNTGNQSINGVNVSDPLIGTNLSAATESGGTGTNGDGILDVGETWTYTGTYTAVQGDIDDNGGGDGDIDNTATVTSTEITDPQSATEDVPVDQNPAYVIAKTVTDVGGDGATGVVDAAGDVISYEITVDNTGNQSINGVNVSDPLIGTNLSAATESGGTGTNGDGILDVGETWTYTGTYTAVQGDIDDNGGGDGDIDNTATVTSTEITDPQSATEDVPVDQNPAYVIAKTVTDVGGDGATGVVDAAGDVISYEITVDNTGNQSINGVNVSDPLIGTNLSAATESGGTGTNGDGILDVGETWTYTGTYTAVQGDIDDNGGGDGDIDNTATVTSTEITDPQSATEDVPVDQNPAYVIAKTVTDVGGDGATGVVDAAGDVISYEITVDNTGNQSINGVNVSDPLIGTNLSAATESGGTGTNGDGILDVGETWTYTGTYTAVQGDIDDNGGGDGDIDNTATVTSTEITDPQSATEDVPVDQNPAYVIAKTVTDVGGDGATGVVDAAGDVISYEITVDNTGNQSINGVNVSDPLIGTNLSAATESGGTGTNGDGILDVGETWTYTGTYTAVQGDIDDNGGGDGDIDNTATVTSTEITDPQSATEDVPVDQNPAYVIAKTVTDVGGDGATGVVDAAGDVISYEITVDNTGNQSINGVNVSDPLIGTNLSAATESGGTGTNGDGILDVGETWTYTGTYTAVQGDIDDNGGGDGDIDNTATVTSTEITDPQSATEDVPVDQNPAYVIAKTVTDVGGDGATGVVDAAGDVISYEITVDNTGNQSINGVNVSDPLIGTNLSAATESGGTGTNGDGILDVGETWTYTGTYTAVQGDIDDNGGGDGDIDNTATVTSTEITDPQSATEDVPVDQNPAYVIAKTVTDVGGDGATGVVDAAGDVISYEITVDNTGNQSINGVNVSDPLIGTNLSAATESGGTGTNGDGILDVGETWTYTGTYTAVQGDIDDNGGGDGDIDNTATVTSTEITDPQSATEDVPVDQNPAYVIAKTVTDVGGDGATGVVDAAGDVISYEITVDNTGNQSINGVNVSDPLIGTNLSAATESGGTGTNGDGILDVGETWTYTGTYTAVQGDIDDNGGGDGDIDNTATVTSTEITDPQSATEDVPVDQNPAYVIAKTVTDVGGDGATGVVDAAGDVISYEITVDNTGNQSINGVNVSDPLIGTNLSAATESGGTGTNGDGILDVGETWTYTGTYTAVQGDIDDNGGGDGDIDNTATVTSTEITDPQSATEDVPVDQNPAYVIAKTVTDVGGDGATGVVDAAGDVISYEITVDNTGNQSINGVNVSDPLIGTNLSAATESGGTGTNGDGILDVGETWTYTGTYTAVQGDIDDNGGGDGDIDNTATVTSTEITDPQSATEDVPVDQNPAYVIAKTVTDVGGDGATGVVDAAGDVISYEITVDNTGNQSINGVNVSDPLIGTNLSAATESGGTGTNGDGILDVGETWTYTGTYTAVQGDIDDNGGGDGDIDNTATVTSTEITDPQSATEDVPVDQNPAYVIAKTVTDVGGDGATGVVDAAGDVISYEITVDNTGNQSINGVNVSDPLIGTNLSAATESGGTGTNGDGILDVGETWTYTGTYTAVQGDIDDNGGGDGDIDNTATVTSTEITTPQDATEDVPVVQNPAIAINKVTGDGVSGPVVDSDDLTILAGQSVTWTYTVTNEGNVNLSPIVVTDNITGVTPAYVSGDVGDDGILGLNETWIYEATGTSIAEAYTNTGTAVGGYSDGVNPQTVNDADDSGYFGADPAIAIDKAFDSLVNDLNGNGLVEVGDTIQYTFDVTNAGNVALANVVVDDPKINPLTFTGGDDSNVGFLDLNETWTYTGTYVVTAEDDAAASLSNTATATGDFTDDLGNNEVVDAEDTEVIDIFQKNQRSIQIEDIFGANLPNVPGPGDVDTSYLPTDTNALTFEGNMIEGGFEITDQSELGVGDLVQLQGLDVDIEYKDGNKWKLVDLTGTDTSLTLWADTDLDGAIDGEIDQFIGTISGNDSDVLENTVKPKGQNNEEFDFNPVAVNFDEDVNILFKFTLGASALDDLDGGAIAGNDFRLTAEAFIGGRVDNKGTPTEFFFTETFAAPNALTLDGTATTGGEILTQNELAPVVDAAIDYWAEQGVDAEGLETLLRTDVRIDDLGGSLLLGETDGLVVTLDDDAAGYGWSDSLDDADADQIDLLSALTHEFGHVLGFEHDVMGETLGVGERDLPLEGAGDASDDANLSHLGIEGDLLFG